MVAAMPQHAVKRVAGVHRFIACRTLAEDMDLGFRRIAYLGYGGDHPGLTRY